ncbi:MAG: hypothetical protein ACRDHL_08620 [Candidatus Promineifilaceae bacterium]
MIFSTAVGALTGLATGYLLARNAEENVGQAPKITTTDGIKAAVTTVGLMRLIVGFGERS